MKIIYHTNLNLTTQELDVITQFIVFTYKDLKLKKKVYFYLLPKINDYAITTGGFDYSNKDILKIYCRKEGRAIVDCLRTIAHELVHQMQYEKNKLVGKIQDIGGKIEDEANAIAGQLIKRFAKEKNMKKIYVM